MRGLARIAATAMAASALAACSCAAGGGRSAERAPALTGLAILAEGARSQVEEPFVAVVGDRSVYAELRVASGVPLPDLAESYFASRAVVAVFLGHRPTPGYRALLREEGAGLEIGEEGPPRDAILAQVLTAPFVIASVPRAAGSDVRITLPDSLRRGFRPVSVRRGRFEVSGGIAGRASSFLVVGDGDVARVGRLATIALRLREEPGGEGRALAGIVTGVASPDGSLKLGRLAGSSFVPPPCRELELAARLSPEDGALVLGIGSLPCRVADAFGGSGEVELAPPPPADRVR